MSADGLKFVMKIHHYDGQSVGRKSSFRIDVIYVISVNASVFHSLQNAIA